MSIGRRAAMLALTAAGLATALVGVNPAAHAGTGEPCSGNSCNGLDPMASFNTLNGQECSADAITPGSRSAFGGLLELRWGPHCSTNWTRFTPANNHTYDIYVQRISDGIIAGNGLHTVYVFSNANGVPHYSDQLYSPGPARACVADLTTGSSDVCFSQSK